MRKLRLRKHLIIGVFTFLMLLVLLVVQVLLMIKASKLERKNFNHSVVVALKEARDEIGREAMKCDNMHDYVCGFHCTNELRKINFNKVDSIIQSNLRLHKIDLDYTFEFLHDTLVSKPLNLSSYEQSLNGLLNENGIKLSLHFPNLSKFVFAQMGILFYTSVVSILFLMISFIITYKMYKKERLLVESTSFFIDNMIHEFHTPIANIKLASNLIQRNIDSREKLSKYLKLIKNENNKMECHVSDIQSLMDLNEVTSAEVHFHDIVSECVENFLVNIENRGGSIQLMLGADNDIIQGDGKLIKLVISNLLDNAIKYSNEQPIIELKTHNADEFLIFSIKDNGIGIPVKQQKFIFDKYYRVSTGNVHNIKGFGLGLAFVKEVVIKHNGDIAVINNKKAGVTFSIKWPVKK